VQFRDISIGHLRSTTQVGRRCIRARLAKKGASFRLSVNDLFGITHGYQCQFMVLTGRDPLQSKGISRFLERITAQGTDVLVRTPGFGQRAPRQTGLRLFWDVPSSISGVLDRVQFLISPDLWPGCEVRFSLAHYCDFIWALSEVRRLNLERYPVFFRNDPRAPELALPLRDWLLREVSHVRLCPSMLHATNRCDRSEQEGRRFAYGRAK